MCLHVKEDWKPKCKWIQGLKTHYNGKWLLCFHFVPGTCGAALVITCLLLLRLFHFFFSHSYWKLSLNVGETYRNVPSLNNAYFLRTSKNNVLSTKWSKITSRNLGGFLCVIPIRQVLMLLFEGWLLTELKFSICKTRRSVSLPSGILGYIR